jgi:Domain of unknown function (DUF4168)
MRRIVRFVTTAGLVLAPVLAMAQSPSATIPDQTIGKAGAALHDVAKLQQKYQGQMDSATPEQKKGLSEQANAEAVQAIQSHGISVQEYSTVVRTAQNDPQVKQRLLDAAKQEN